MMWQIRDGWQHRAFIGAGPFTAEQFQELVTRVAEDAGWSPDEAAALSAVYEQVADKPGKES